MSIPVIWNDAARGNWDSGLLLETFDKYPGTFIQYNVKEPPQFDRAIFIIVNKPDVVGVREYLKYMKSGIVILTSDEDAYFDWQAAIPKHLEVWTQYYNQEYKSGIKERVLLGAPSRIKDYKINSHLPKKYLWSFVGQVQNPFREACADVLKRLPDGYLKITPDFGGQTNGMDYQEYLDIMCQSKYVICPSGSMSADSFRLYEGMECGAIPVTDMRCPRDAPDFNYWDSVYPNSKLISVSEWFKALMLAIFKENYSADQNKWWFEYKKELEKKLLNAANQD